jgi:hypothetical protein
MRKCIISYEFICVLSQFQIEILDLDSANPLVITADSYTLIFKY